MAARVTRAPLIVLKPDKVELFDQLFEQICLEVGAEVLPQTKGTAALANVAHRGNAEEVEREICKGLYENAKVAVELGLPEVSQEYDENLSTTDFDECASIVPLIGRPLRNMVHKGLGADIVVLMPDGETVGHFLMCLIQLKCGNTPIGGHQPKSIKNQRGAYSIHNKLVQIGKELAKTLEKRNDVVQVTKCYYLMSTATVRPDALKFFAEKKVTVIEGKDTITTLMHKALQYSAGLLL